MKRLQQVRLMHKIVPCLNRFLGSMITQRICNWIGGEPWVFEREVFDPEVKRICRRGFIMLPGGCYWDKCTFCPYKTAVKSYSKGEKVTSEELKLLFEIGFSVVQEVEVLEIWTGGSFFWEIPPDVQEYILSTVAKKSSLRKIRVESLPGLINMKRLNQIGKILKDKQLDVAIGLETQNDELRKRLNKFPVMTKKLYERAIVSLKESGFRSSTYVMLKPDLMSEVEAIEDAVKTIKYAFEVGTDEILLETTFIAEGTQLKEVWLRGDYQLPSLWSVVAVLKATKGLGPVYLGEFQDNPPPLAGPTSCPKCQPTLLTYFKKYRQTLEPDCLTNLPKCSCREKWSKEVGSHITSYLNS
jgi:radical SAM enzyme (TIGR01210 family)